MNRPQSIDELLSSLVSFRSLSHQEQEIASFLADVLDVAGIRVEMIDANVVATIGSGGTALLLNSHLDVVPPSSNHPFAPFSPTIQDDRLYGRGSVDAKASVASMSWALLELAQNHWHPPEGLCLVGAFTVCEEIGGGHNGLEAIRPQLPPLGAALIGEPTELAPCTAQKGMLILEATARGKTSHAARAHLGDNAIAKAVADISAVGETRFDRDHALLGQTTANVTVIEGGTVHNVIPDECKFTIDARITPAYTAQEVLDAIRSRMVSEVRIRSNRYIPVETDADELIVRAAVEVTGKDPFGSATASDWVYVHDIPTVKLGPGDSNLSHTGEESIALPELRRAPAVYRSVVERYFQNYST